MMKLFLAQHRVEEVFSVQGFDISLVVASCWDRSGPRTPTIRASTSVAPSICFQIVL